MDIIFFEFKSIAFSTESNKMKGCSTEELSRYLKGVYSNRERFISRFVEKKLEQLAELKKSYPDRYNQVVDFLNSITKNFDKCIPFTFKEAFELKEREFQALVFSSINITEMINKLGAKRIKTDGINVKHRKYDTNGNFLGLEDYHNIYETHEVDGTELGINSSLYVVKCWCTSTNKEHWLWIDEKYKNDPLNAIASTFMVHENVIPHIKALKRQGDLLLVETDEEVVPEGNMVSLSKEQYFGLLVAQS